MEGTPLRCPSSFADIFLRRGSTRGARGAIPLEVFTVSRVMVIDDDAGVRMAVRRILERAGHTVIEEPSGKSTDPPSRWEKVRSRLNMKQLSVEARQALHARNISSCLTAVRQ